MSNQSPTKLLLLALLGMTLAVAYLLLRAASLEGALFLPQVSGSMNLGVIFLTGLTIGGLTCLAVQGGLLASVITAREEEEIEKGINRKSTVFPTLAFLSTKLVAYIILGFILGAFGGAVGISQNTQIIMQFAAGLYMVAVALNLLNVHPIFRYVVIQPPKFLARMVKNQSKSKDLFAPAFLGAMTVLIPCGTTLAMEALAISSGNAFTGAAVMAAFVLGTMPLFFGVGWLTSILGDNFRGNFLKVAALAVLYLGLTSLNGALTAAGYPIEINLRGGQSSNIASSTVPIKNGVQTVNMSIYPNGYSPTYFKVKSGTPVRLNLATTSQIGCTAAFRIPSLGISKQLGPSSIDTIEFTPKNPGKIAFTCSMGMYSGIIEVI